MRNRYLDLLRAAAIVRVIAYHLIGWPWLSILLPAMGVMSALAGSLMAASLSKRSARKVVTSRLRRLLPPLWLLGLISVPVMLAGGWASESDGEHPFGPGTLLYWILPVGDPPGSDRAVDVWEPLWYLRAYVWFVLLSPLLFVLWRKVGLALLALPLLVMAALEVTGLTLPDTADAALWDFATYGGCWIAGFAHHDGRLARIPPWLAYPIASVMGAAGLWWAAGAGSWDLDDVSEAQALWSLGFLLVVLRRQPPTGRLARTGPLDKVAAAILLTASAVPAFGWAEDLAARRRPRLWPSTTVPSGTPAEKPAAAPAVGTAPYRVRATVRMPRPAQKAATEPEVQRDARTGSLPPAGSPRAPRRLGR